LLAGLKRNDVRALQSHAGRGVAVGDFGHRSQIAWTRLERHLLDQGKAAIEGIDVLHSYLLPIATAHRRHSSMRLATSPDQPVWWEAPSPCPVSPWKNSYNKM
jgi:hypothetical protein